MTTITELQEKLKRIKAKITLGLPLTNHEYALWVLYGGRK